MTPIAITPGDPAGIGPDLIAKLLQRQLDTPIVVVADADLLHARAGMLGMPLPKHLMIEHVPLRAPAIAGKPDQANAAYILETLSLAAKGCQQKKYSALVTGPVSKAVIDPHFPFLGHTEWLANYFGVDTTVMLFVTQDHHYIALLTTHIPLAKVAKAINPAALTRTIHVLRQGINQYFKLQDEPITILGLNPHAGEEGLLGREEIEVITPVIRHLNEQGLQLIGPISADAAFTPSAFLTHRILLAMYHDQALPAIKALGFGHAVNVTLGLPIIRTSVDHGTAFSLAGTGKAEDTSLFAALLLAEKMASAVP